MANIVLSVGPAHMNVSPFGFYLFGRDFFEAGQSFAGREKALVPYFLYSQAIELGLKAFLLLKGMTKNELKNARYGHNLSKLLKVARARGLDAHVSLSPKEIEAIGIATDFYDSGASGRRFQYFDVFLAFRGFKGLPNRAELQSAVAKLTDKSVEGLYLSA